MQAVLMKECVKKKKGEGVAKLIAGFINNTGVQSTQRQPYSETFEGSSLTSDIL